MIETMFFSVALASIISVEFYARTDKVNRCLSEKRVKVNT